MLQRTVNGRYRLIKQIGVGGFGLTFLAEDLHLASRPKCVVKQLKPPATDAASLTLANRLFQQEAEVLYRLGAHPQIPSLIAHFKEEGEFFLVQEFIRGNTIGEEFASAPLLDQGQTMRLIGQVLEILSFVHGENVIHRDIKPANLIRKSSDGAVFLIDFGAVKQVRSLPNDLQHSTFSTLAIGSHGYMPAEQMAGRPNFASDLYALGLIAVEALSTHKPLDLRRNNVTNEIIWAPKTDVDPEFQHFVSRLIKYDFRQRFYSAREALHALNVIAGRAGFFRGPTVQSPNQFAPPEITVSPGSVTGDPVEVPPTVIVTTRVGQSAQSWQTVKPVSPNLAAFVPPESDEMSKGAKFGVFFGLIALLVAGFFVASRSVVTGYQTAKKDSEAVSSSPPPKSAPQTPSTALSTSDGSALLFEEALNQAREADKMSRGATTQHEWKMIGGKYERAYRLLASIREGTAFYEKAQGRIAEFKQHSDNAFEKSRTLVAKR